MSISLSSFEFLDTSWIEVGLDITFSYNSDCIRDISSTSTTAHIVFGQSCTHSVAVVFELRHIFDLTCVEAQISELNAMTRQPDLVLLTGDVTHNGSDDEWNELLSRLEPLQARWEALAGNHDRTIEAIAGHRSFDAGPLRIVLLDTSNGVGSHPEYRPSDRV